MWQFRLWTQGRPTQKEKITADGRLNRGFKWTALEHMDDTTNDLAALTQNDTWKDLVIKSNERQMDYPNRLQMMNRGCHVQERHLLPINTKAKHIPFPNFSPTIAGKYLFIFTQA
jgi:hypothetical protein